MSYATSSAKLSAVCVGAGGENSTGAYSQSNLPSYSQMFNSASKSVKSKGSGVIIKLDKTSGEAYILTCNHVVSGYSAIFVLLYDSYQPIYAQLVGAYPAGDIAVLKIASDEVKTSYCQAATIADSTYITEGEPVLTVGNPLGNGFSVSTGSISKTSIYISSSGKTLRCIQTDTPINSGNSGGGLFDQNGQLIGLVNSKTTDSSSYDVDNIAFAIHSNTALSIANNIIEGRNLQYAPAGYTLSISSSNITAQNGKIYNFVNVKVASITAGSDAYNAGLREGDQITSMTINGKTIAFNTLYIYEENMYNLKIGDTVTYTIAGKSSPVVVSITSVAI
jgi:serine protease Do